MSSSSVRINNLVLSANDNTLREFFSFCGGINRITLIPVDSTVQSAIIEFDSETAARTACILTNSDIGNKPITVVLETNGGGAGAGAASPAAATPSFGEEHSQSVGADNHPSLAAEILASTILGAKNLNAQYHITEKTKSAVAAATGAAKQLDEKHNITGRASEKIKKINEDHHIAEKITAAKTQTIEKAKEIDEKYAVKSQAQFAGFVAVEKTKELTEKALAVPTVAAAVGWLSYGISSIKNTVSSVAAETKSLVHQQEQAYAPPPAYNTAAYSEQQHQEHQQEQQQQQQQQQQQEQQQKKEEEEDDVVEGVPVANADGELVDDLGLPIVDPAQGPKAE